MFGHLQQLKLAQLQLKLAEIKIDKQFKNFANGAQFRQIWSHCFLLARKELPATFHEGSKHFKRFKPLRSTIIR